MTNFYNGIPDFKYPEFAICLEDTDGPYAKIFIPVATPILSHNIAYDNTLLPVDISNIKSDNINENNLVRVTDSNYIIMKLPDDKPAKKNDKFIIAFIGGDVNNVVLIGRCN